MATIKRFEDIEAWKLARELCRIVYRLTNKGSFTQDFGFRNQIRNAAGSTMDNIAEGYGRGGNKEFINFLGISMASASEVQSQSYRALDVGHIDQSEFKELYELAGRVGKADWGLIEYLQACEIKGIKFKK